MKDLVKSAFPVGLFFASVAAAASRNPPPARLVEGPGLQLVNSYCSICHSTEYIPMNAPAQDRAGWEKTVTKMVNVFGAPIPERDRALIVDYLARNHSKPAPAVKE